MHSNQQNWGAGSSLAALASCSCTPSTRTRGLAQMWEQITCDVPRHYWKPAVPRKTAGLHLQSLSCLCFFINYGDFFSLPNKIPWLQLKHKLWSTAHPHSQSEQQDLLSINTFSPTLGKWHSCSVEKSVARKFHRAVKFKVTQLFSLLSTIPWDLTLSSLLCRWKTPPVNTVPLGSLN